METLGYQNMADDVASFFKKKKLDIRKPAFCGFSDGAIIGMLVAEESRPAVKADSLRRECLSFGDKGEMVSAVPSDQPFRQGSEDPDDAGGAADYRGGTETD